MKATVIMHLFFKTLIYKKIIIYSDVNSKEKM